MDRTPCDHEHLLCRLYGMHAYSYLPFMILPLYSALEKMDLTLVEAAQDLGCSRAGAHLLEGHVPIVGTQGSSLEDSGVLFQPLVSL